MPLGARRTACRAGHPARKQPPDVALGAKPIEVEGVAKPTAARVMALARGGQTLLTEDAPAALGDTAAPAVARPLAPEGPRRADRAVRGRRRGRGASTPPPDGDKAYRVVRKDDLWLPVRQIAEQPAAAADDFIGRAEGDSASSVPRLCERACSR